MMPVQNRLPHVVRLHSALEPAARKRYVTDPEDWCRQNLVQAHEQWCRQTETGPDRSGYLPVFSFSDQDTAFAFKLRWY
jgi:hypothetical protein